MVDFNYCDHECACQHNGHLEAAQQYSSLLSKVMNKNADSEPVSKEEKDKWNNKANQDVVDLIKTMVEKHEEKLDELEDGLDKKVKLILYDLGFGDNVLAKYATIEYVNELVAKIKNDTADLSKYALKTDLDTIKNDILNKINNLTTEINNIKVIGGKDYSIESFNYNSANGLLVLKQKNGGEFTVSIVVGGIDTSKLVTKELLINELTKYAEINKLKKLQVGGNTYTLYDPNGNGVIKIDGSMSSDSTGVITADVVGETRYLYLNNDNTNKAYSGEAGLHLYNSGTEISFSHEFESLKCSNSSTISGWNSWFSYANNVISMTIPEGKLDMSDGKYWTLRVKLTPTDTAILSNVRYVDIQFYGIISSSGANAVSYRLDTSASVINYLDGSLYPSMISFYLTKGDGDVVTLIYPNEPSSWTFSYSTDGGSEWKPASLKEIPTEGQDGMYFRAQNGSLDFKEYVPIIKAPAVDGINGVTYKIEVSDMSLNYKANEGNKYNISSTFTVKLYKKEGNADYALLETAGYNCNVSTNPSVEVTPPTKSDNQWACSISGEVSSSSATILIIINNSNGAFVDSITIPISAAGKDGGAGTGLTFKGSPLRILDSWESGKKYYDGKRDAENGVFYQDVVLYNNMYYACINTEAGESDLWKNAPDAASYWKVFAVTENFVADKIIANLAYIKELSSNEIVIFDGSTIVAGMTSSKDIDSKSDLNKKVTNKGNVRIWAGGMQKEGDLTSAPFTVTDAGVLKCQAASGNSITLKDGTIYFVVEGATYHLGITNGKPDWINSDAADRTETWYKKDASDKNISFTLLGEFAIKDNKYYTDATMKVAVSGTYYKKVAVSSILYLVGIYTYLTYASTFGVEIYNKASFVNGTKTMQGTVAITGSASVDTIPSPSPSGEISGTLNVLTTNKTWAKISKVDKPTGTFTYYVTDMIGSTSDSVKYTGVKSDNITFYNNTTTGIYVMSASDTEGSNLYTNLSGWLITRDSEINTTKYEIRNYDLNLNFKP